MWTTIIVIGAFIVLALLAVLCLRLSAGLIGSLIGNIREQAERKKRGSIEVTNLSDVFREDTQTLLDAAHIVRYSSVDDIPDEIRAELESQGYFDQTDDNDEADTVSSPLVPATAEELEADLAIEASNPEGESLSSEDSAEEEEDTDPNHPVIVIDFDDDDAKDLANFQQKVWAVLALNAAYDGITKVIIRINSPGGAVTTFSRASTLLEDLKRDCLFLEAHIDEIGASGGYMLGVVCHRIVATKLSMIGSIGVVTEFPNVHRALRGLGVDVHTITGGEKKRSASLIGAMDAEDVVSIQERVDKIHELFKAHVLEHRPGVDIERVATGDAWSATEALELGLVDAIGSSMSELERLRRMDKEILLVDVKKHRPRFATLIDRFAESAVRTAYRLVLRDVERVKR